ncbi:hypothetical protein KUTeg_006017, partial [Tegillarca granosa]
MYKLIVLALVHVAFGIDPKVTIMNTDPKTVLNDLNRKEVVVLKDKDVSFTCVVINREPDKKETILNMGRATPEHRGHFKCSALSH